MSDAPDFPPGRSPGDYYKECARQADLVRVKIAAVRAKLADPTVGERRAEKLREQLRKLDEELLWAGYTGD